MRAMFTLTASLAICAGLFGCNRPQQAQAPAAPSVAAVTPVCNCPQVTAAAAPRRIVHHRRYHRRHTIREFENSVYAGSYGMEQEDHAASYGAVRSDEEREEYRAYAGRSAQSGPGEGEVWVDGYGRSHYVLASETRNDNPAALTVRDTRKRLSPWHGFNADCDRIR